MEGWLYGLFTLFGVLAGGLFTYLGLRKQLNQQKEINKIEWRRKVRSEPLFALRDELSVMATKAQNATDSITVFLVRSPNIQDEKLITRILDDCEKAVNDVRDYLVSGPFQKTLFTIDDKELHNKVRELVDKYIDILKTILPQLQQIRKSLIQPEFSLEKLEQPIQIPKGIQSNVQEIQALVNQKLETL